MKPFVQICVHTGERRLLDESELTRELLRLGLTHKEIKEALTKLATSGTFEKEYRPDHAHYWFRASKLGDTNNCIWSNIEKEKKP